ncbi:MAG: hypothetical protein JNJ54_19065 [Myxococcaceae bacterium]|nr:hypothetical protein [Myxococcaceae bacterium]
MRLVAFLFCVIVVALLPLGGCGRTECPSGVCLPDAAAGQRVDGGFFAGGGGAAGGAVAGGSAGAAGGGAAGGGAAGGGAAGGGSAAGGSAGGATGGGAASSDGGCAPGSLIFFPTTLDFGEQAAGCARSEPIVFLNTCATAQSLSLSATPMSQLFRVDAGLLVVPPGGALEVPVTFDTPVLGPRQATLTGSSSSGLLSIPLRGLGVVPADVTDAFAQPAIPKADLLFVVSDGPGMVPAQQWLGAGSSPLLQYATTNQVDFRVGVVAGRLDGGSPTVLSPVMPQFMQAWQQQFLLGDTGAPTTSCLARAWQLLSAGAGWLRADSTFGLVCAQNTHEQLVGSPGAWVRLLQRAAARGRNQLTISAVANFTRACPGPDDAALAAAATMTLGSTQSVCALDGGSLEAIGRTAFGYRTTFFLSRAGPADGGVEVAIDGVPLPSRDALRDAGIWAFDPLLNAVVFEPLSVPEPGKTLTARYRAACGR